MGWEILEPTRGFQPFDGVKISYLVNEKGRRLRILFGPAIREKCGFEKGARVAVEVGSGKERGLLRVRSASGEENGYLLGWSGTKSRAALMLQFSVSRLGWRDKGISAVPVESKVEGGAVVITLPPEIWKRPERLEDGFRDDPRAIADKGSPGPAVGPSAGNLRRVR